MSVLDLVTGEQPQCKSTAQRHEMERNDHGNPGGSMSSSSRKKPARKKPRLTKDAQKAQQSQKPLQPVDVNADPQIAGISEPAPDGDETPRGEKTDSGVDGQLKSPSLTASVQAKRASIGKWPDLAESSGDVAEKEAEDLPPKESTRRPVEDRKERKSVDAARVSEPTHAYDSSKMREANGSALLDGSLKKGSKPGPKDFRDHDYPPLTDTASEEAAAYRRDRENAYRAGAIRFAPWNIPFRRRLQTLAVLVHCLSIATTVSFFFFLCAIPLTWPILIPYLLHMLLSKSATDGRLRMRSERFRRLPVWRFFADYFPAKLHKTHDLPPTRKYIFGYHPHGIISHGAFAAFATEALGFADKFPGITNSLVTLDSNFRIPLYRDYILAMGIQSVSKESITNVLTRGGPNGEGMGRAVTIVVGGARESLEARPGVMRLVLAERKGFVKMAMRTGADLVPVLAFGENDLYDQVNTQRHPSLHRLQMWVLKTLKFTLPFLHGRGIFNYDVGLMPYRRPLNIVVGRPIMVAQAREGEIDPAEVDRLHREYVGELQRMWDAYKDVFARDREEELRILK
ncbi:hypothetical protein VTK56DRAFT_311 [Thermocarpiscus australiensis]